MTTDIPEYIQKFVDGPAPSDIPMFCQVRGCPHGAGMHGSSDMYSQREIIRVFSIASSPPQNPKKIDMSWSSLKRNSAYIDVCAYHLGIIRPEFGHRFSTSEPKEGDSWQWISG